MFSSQSTKVLLSCIASVALGSGELACGGETGEDVSQVTLLVRACVVGVKREKGFVASTLRIEHVYSGPNELIGQVFTNYVRSSGEDSIGHGVYPPPKNGEHGIWSLREVRGELGHVPYPWVGVAGWPVRNVPGARYEQAKELAEAIEVLDKVSAAGRWVHLRQFARSEVAEVASWAIHTMAQFDIDRTTAFLEQTVGNTRLCLGAQIALDEVLCEAKAKTWKTSPKRESLLREWVSREATMHDTELVLRRLDVAIQHQEIEPVVAVDLLSLMIANRQVPLRLRRSALWIVGPLYRHRGGSLPATIFLVDVLSSAEEPDLQIGAAYVLRNSGAKIDDERAALLKAVAKKTTVKELQVAVRSLLEDQGTTTRVQEP